MAEDGDDADQQAKAEGYRIRHYSKEKPIQCLFCNMVLNTVAGFRQHRLRTHDVAQNRYQPLAKICMYDAEGRNRVICLFCKKSFASVENFNNHATHDHVETHDEGEHMLYQCIFCDISNKDVYEILKHIQIHLENGDAALRRDTDTSFSCFTCNRMFITSRGLEKHKSLEHTSDPYNKYQPLGSICMYDGHENNDRLQCLLCPKQFPEVFPNVKSFNEHAIAKHVESFQLTGEGAGKAFKCRACDKIDTDLKRILIHLEYHGTALKAFLMKAASKRIKCQTCNKICQSDSGLSIHRAHVHKNEIDMDEPSTSQAARASLARTQQATGEATITAGHFSTTSSSIGNESLAGNESSVVSNEPSTSQALRAYRSRTQQSSGEATTTTGQFPTTSSSVRNESLAGNESFVVSNEPPTPQEIAQFATSLQPVAQAISSRSTTEQCKTSTTRAFHPNISAEQASGEAYRSHVNKFPFQNVIESYPENSSSPHAFKEYIPSKQRREEATTSNLSLPRYESPIVNLTDSDSPGPLMSTTRNPLLSLSPIINVTDSNSRESPTSSQKTNTASETLQSVATPLSTVNEFQLAMENPSTTDEDTSLISVGETQSFNQHDILNSDIDSNAPSTSQAALSISQQGINFASEIIHLASSSLRSLPATDEDLQSESTDSFKVSANETKAAQMITYYSSTDDSSPEAKKLK